MNTTETVNPEPGISLALAAERPQTIQDLHYDLSFSIPASTAEPIAAQAKIRFNAIKADRSLILDFAPGAAYLDSITIGGKASKYHAVNGHIAIPKNEVSPGENSIDIAFRAGDASLNRNPDFMYTLFVPARAHLAFPCFDQPDLKAQYTLELTIPPDWESVSNGVESSREATSGGVRVRYAETQPISTYLFAFAAGKFQVETSEQNGRKLRMFHRETDAKKVARNRDAVFNLHASSLEWMEKYTAIPYPFGKFDFVLIPSFQFGGMEHPGAIFYNASSILLDESATENQMLNRASTIAHETSHMWFGDLVTMRWFNDVWMKEVFANFMAGKIVNPAFPKINHELRFFTSNYPAAYDVDRTAGTHPIRQDLANLNEAGSLYGAIIYQKAPIVMRQLELILGADRLQEGLREYLMRFRFGNSTWLDLIRLLDERTDADLPAWSRAWVEESGRPSIRTEVAGHQVSLIQSDPQPGRSLTWRQRIRVLAGTTGTTRAIAVDLENQRTELPASQLPNQLDFVLPAGGGLAYGDFTLDDRSRQFLLEHVPELADPVARGAAWTTLWEEMLDGRVRPRELVKLALRALPQENTEQNVQLIVNYLSVAFWKFLPVSVRREVAPVIEQTLRSGLARADSSSLKATYFSAFRSIVTTPQGIAFLETVWRRREKIPGLLLAETDEASMALDLAVRSVPAATGILEEQRQRFMNPDRKARFEFVTPALSDDLKTREAWFQNLMDVKNRRREPWVIEGLRYLNHPLHAADSEKYVRPALDLLQEIQRTGDIFFPKNWMDAVLGGHNSRAVAETVRRFLNENPKYPIRLRRIILQSADDLFRATDILDKS